LIRDNPGLAVKSLIGDQEPPLGWQACVAATDAKWWIDHRDLPNVDLMARIRQAACAPDAVINYAQAWYDHNSSSLRNEMHAAFTISWIFYN